MDYVIREEQEKDVEQVRALLCEAFSTDAESRLVDALRANEKAIISLVAVCADDVLGHILFSPVTTSPPTEANGVGLAPVAVLPQVQSQGIGSELILMGLRRGQDLGYDFCVVLGSPEYYHRFGFERASDHGLDNEYGADEEFMAISFTNRKASGLVRYASEFGLFSV
ncbi:MAG: GNAT family N-acetyltransferase [Bacteroidota bacterium]